MVSFEVYTEGLDNLPEKAKMGGSKAEESLALIVRKDTSSFVPFQTGMLDKNTMVKGNFIIYASRYARYLYVGKYMVDSETGKGPSRYIDANGNEVIRYRKDSRLRATSRNLDIKKRSGHNQAQSHWFEGSKAQNIEKWKREVARVMSDEFHK